MKLTRKGFLKGSVAGFAAMLGGAGYSTLVEPLGLSLERVATPIRDLPEALEGFRIAVLSDFHLQPFTTLAQIEQAVHAANALKPDLVVLLGDYVDATAAAIHDLAPALGRLNARYGVFGVVGNHDHWKGVKIVQAALQKGGIAVLRNSGIALTVGQSGFYLAGVDSVWAGHADLSQAMAAKRDSNPTILLAHEPDFADKAARDPRVSLQLSGHSHGGQVRLPLIGALQLPSWGVRYDQGLYRVKAMQLYTNRGLGVVGIPVRFNCPPELTEITLTRAVG